MSDKFVLSDGSPAMLSIGNPWPTSITFAGGLKIHSDGRIEADPSVRPDEAATKVLEALRQLAPSWFKEPISK